MRELMAPRIAAAFTWRMGVPVATTVNCTDVVAAVSAMAADTEVVGRFEREVGAFLGADYMRVVNSGRSALFLTLTAMNGATSRREVVVPAFACPSIGRAVVKAGLEPVLCDVGVGGSGLDVAILKKIVTPRTLAVVVAHLFGYPSDISAVIEIARRQGAMVIEDAAQAFGARFNGRHVGTVGDAGIFSFGISKVLGSMAGGAIVTSHRDLQKRLDAALATLPVDGIVKRLAGVLKLASLAVLLRSHYLGPIASLWGSAFRGKDDCTDFNVRRMSSVNARVGRSLLSRYAEITSVRRANARFYMAALAGCDELILPEATPEMDSVYLRFPVIVKDVAFRKLLVSGLRARGVNVSQMYGRESYNALRSFANWAPDCPRTEYLSDRILNLPTHAFVDDFDRAAVVEVFASLLGT